jgi:hypothetical protein
MLVHNIISLSGELSWLQQSLDVSEEGVFYTWHAALHEIKARIRKIENM